MSDEARIARLLAKVAEEQKAPAPCPMFTLPEVELLLARTEKAHAAGMQAGLGRLEGFKDAVRLEIDTRYAKRLHSFHERSSQELAALRALVMQLYRMAGPKPALADVPEPGEENYRDACEMLHGLRARAEKADARVQELEKAYKDAAGKLAGVRLIALSWEDDARNLNTVRTLPASTLMDCREQMLTALGDDDAT